MAIDDLAFDSAVELAAAIRARKVSPLEVTRAVLARIKRHNPSLNALVTVPEGAALCAAAKAEEAVMRGERLGLLHGVPLHVKDNLYVADSRTTFGSKLFEQNLTDEDCPAVKRLREAGMILVGRTNTSEFGWKGVTDNRVFGITRNPWNTDLTPGGSSGGAAAAVAAGLGPIGLGTDGGGSLRIPAAFCGVVGFKASFGRVPNWPGSGGAMLRHIGAITRTVGDQAAALDAMAGPDARDLLSLPSGEASFASQLDRGIRGKRIAYSSNLGYARVDPEVAAICRRAAERFAETGAHVEPIQLDWRDPYETWSVFFFGTAAAAVEQKLATLRRPARSRFSAGGGTRAQTPRRRFCQRSGRAARFLGAGAARVRAVRPVAVPDAGGAAVCGGAGRRRSARRTTSGPLAVDAVHVSFQSDRATGRQRTGGLDQDRSAGWPATGRRPACRPGRAASRACLGAGAAVERQATGAVMAKPEGRASSPPLGRGETLTQSASEDVTHSLAGASG